MWSPYNIIFIKVFNLKVGLSAQCINWKQFWNLIKIKFHKSLCRKTVSIYMIIQNRKMTCDEGKKKDNS